MMKKKILIPGILILIIIGLHLLAGFYISNQLEKRLSSQTFMDLNDNVKKGKVSVYPFRGDIYITDIKYTTNKDPFEISAGSIGTDLTYLQFWSLVLSSPSTLFKPITRLNLEAHSLKIQTANGLNRFKKAQFSVVPIDPHPSTDKQSIWKQLKQETKIDIKLHEVSLPLPHRWNSYTLNNISPNPLSLERMDINGTWNYTKGELNIDAVSVNSPVLKGTGKGKIRLDNSGSTFQIADWTHNLSFNDHFNLDFSAQSGSFKGKDMSWNHNLPASTNYLSSLSSITGGEHNIKIQTFSWVPSPEIQKKLQSRTGGIGLPGDTLNGKDLTLNYTYNLSNEKLSIHNLSFSAPAFDVKAKSTILVNPKAIKESFVQNGEIRIYKLSKQLQSTIKQFEQFLNTDILDASNQSIRIYIRGNLNQLQWELI